MISGNSSIDVELGESVTLTFHVTDADGEEVFLSFVGNLTSDDYTISSTSNIFSFAWTPSDTSPVSLS